MAKKSSKEKAVYTGTKAKNIVPTVSKQYKVSTPARPRRKAPIKTVVVEQLQEHAEGGSQRGNQVLAQSGYHNALDKNSEWCNLEISIDSIPIFNFITNGCVVI